MPLIAVEGADAVGKSTQTELLGAYLSKRASERGVEFRYMHLPRLAGGRFSSLLHKFLTGSLGRGVQLEPQLAALLFACDRFDARDRLGEGRYCTHGSLRGFECGLPVREAP